jgi:hypothetical protein
MRHPIAVACATQKWSWTSYTALIDHWLKCHELMVEDARHLPQLLLIRYEDFVADPDARLADAFRYVDLEPQPAGLKVRSSVNDAYFSRWFARRWNPVKKFDTDRAIDRFGDRVARFGYSMSEPARLGDVAEIPVGSAERVL